MKQIRHLTILLAFVASSFVFTTSALAESGEKAVGLRGGFTTTHNAPTAGLFFSYRFTSHFRLASAIDYYFKKDQTDAFALNIDANVPFSIGSSGKFNLYPLAGVSLTSWNFHHTQSADNNDSTTRKNRLGINIGGGAEYYCTPTLKLALEGKYSCVKHYDGGIFTLSIGYVF